MIRLPFPYDTGSTPPTIPRVMHRSVQREVFKSLKRAFPEASAIARSAPFLRVGRDGRRAPVWRVDDQRCEREGDVAAPGTVASGGLSTRRIDGIDAGLLFGSRALGKLGLVQEHAIAKAGLPIAWDAVHAVAGPHTLEIGMTRIVTRAAPARRNLQVIADRRNECAMVFETPPAAMFATSSFGAEGPAPRSAATTRTTEQVPEPMREWRF